MEFVFEIIRLMWAHWYVVALLEIGIASAAVYAKESAS